MSSSEYTTQQLKAKPFTVRYSAVLILVGLAVLFMLLHLHAEWGHFRDDASAHNEPAIFLSSAFLWHAYGRATFENLQSEAWQLVFDALVFKYAYALGSSQSKESDNNTTAMLERIERKLDAHQSAEGAV